MQESFKEKLAVYGRWTYRGAWALEITAALLGLATGLALGYQAFATAASNTVTSFDLVLASAPFLMVAIAELTKIPIATLLFSANWIWKPLVFIALTALAGITFETVFMGLERAATLRQLRYENIVNQKLALGGQIEQLTERLSEAKSQDLLRKAKEDLELISQQADQERAAVESQIGVVEKELEGQRVVLPASARVRDLVSEKAIQLTKLTAERDAAIRDAVGEFERQRDSYVERIKGARDAEIERRYQEELARLPNPRRRIEQLYQLKVSSLEAEISSLRTQFDRLQINSPAMTAAQRQQLTSRRDELRQKQNQIDRDWEDRKAVARRQFEEAQSTEAGKQKVSQSEQLSKNELSAKLTSIENERVELARTDQIRRIAARLYGVRPETVSDDQAGFVSVLWFGSLAMLAALAGPLTAIVALALQKIGTSDHMPSKLSLLIRRMLLTWRWRRTRNVPTPFEVITEKEIERRVEVPVERVVKEILYIPVLTDDPDAIRKSLTDTLPKDIAELVTVNFGKSRNAGAA